MPATVRREHHRQVTHALEERRRTGLPVYAGDLARHAAAALPAVPAADAVAWAREAAAAEEARFAFAEAARHLTRVRHALGDAGHDLPVGVLVSLGVAESDLCLKAGEARVAHELLELAWSRAERLADNELMGAVALGLDRCGARFAMPRERLIGVLEAARSVLSGSGGPLEARVTAALARQFQHSVPADRPRARPLAEEAVAIARGGDDPNALAECLLAQHDSLWTPGTSVRRVDIAREITALARRTGDRGRRTKGSCSRPMRSWRADPRPSGQPCRSTPRSPATCTNPGTTTCC